MADLFEFLIGTGMRKGEALGLHWDDVHSAGPTRPTNPPGAAYPDTPSAYAAPSAFLHHPPGP